MIFSETKHSARQAQPFKLEDVSKIFQQEFDSKKGIPLCITYLSVDTGERDDRITITIKSGVS